MAMKRSECQDWEALDKDAQKVLSAASTSVTAVRTSATRRRSAACPGELEGVKVREGSEVSY